MFSVSIADVDGNVVVPSEPFADAPWRYSLGQPEHPISPDPRSDLFAIDEHEKRDEEHTTRGG